MKGINIRRHNINNLHYMDDIVLLAENETDLQLILNVKKDKNREFWLDMSMKKTKTMVISRQTNTPTVNIFIDNEKLEHVTIFTYLGQNINQGGKCIS